MCADCLRMSGMIGLDPATRLLVTGGPYAEAKQVRVNRLVQIGAAAACVASPCFCCCNPFFYAQLLAPIFFCQILSLLCAALPDWGLGLEHLVRARAFVWQALL